jgi:hypothetical protein
MSEEDPSVEDTSSEEESDNESTPEEPSTPLNTNQSLPVVTEWLQNVHLNDMSINGGSTRGGGGDVPSGPKVNSPKEFAGSRNQFEAFRMQCLLSIEMGGTRLVEPRKQMLFVISFLRGPAYDWVHPHLKDYLSFTNPDRQKATTRALFTNVTHLFDEMEATFDYGNEALEAERDLLALRQRASAAKYKAEFQILAAKVEYNDEALASQFYRGLKDNVKDEIARQDRPTKHKEMYELAIKIDGRIYERQLEKKGKSFAPYANSKAKREVPAWKDDYYGLQRMQLDATKGKPGSNKKGPPNGGSKRPQPNKGTTDKSNVECYGCGKKGHYKNECNARKQRHDLQGSGQNNNRDREFRATKGDGNDKAADNKQVESMKATQGRGSYDLNGTNIADRNLDDHGMVTWTACFDDDCAIHLSDKFGSGYWPTKKTRSVCRTIGGPGQVVRYTAGYPPQEESSSEEEEESSEEEGEIIEANYDLEEPETTEFTRTADSNDAILRLLQIVWESKGLVLPWNGDGDEQMVNERELWILIGKIRATLWKMPHEKHSTDYTKVVQEHPPLGSTFTPGASYTTVEGVIFSPELRSRLRRVKADFLDEAATQASNGGAQYSSGSVDLYTLPQRLAPPQIVFEEPEEVRRQPRTRQNRPPTPYTDNYSVWEPPLSTSDPNYVPRRPISMQQGSDVPQIQQSRLGLRSEAQQTSSGSRRANQRSGN